MSDHPLAGSGDREDLLDSPHPPSPLDDSSQFERLRRYVAWNISVNAAGALLTLSFFVAFGHSFFALFAAEILVNLLVMVWIYRQTDPRVIEAGMVASCAVVFAVVLSVMFATPVMFPAILIPTLLPIALAFPYLGRSALRRLAVGTALVVAAESALSLRRDSFPLGRVPQWAVDATIVAFVPMATGLLLLLLWQYSTRLNETLEQTRRANAALQASERSLESKVSARTAELARKNEDLIRSEWDLALARDQALEASRAKTAFLANMSHELRTPLNAVIGYGELLQEEAAERGQDDLLPDLRRIKVAGEQLLGLVNAVLDLSKIEAGKMELYEETFAVAPLVDEVLGTIRPLAQQRANALEVRGVDDRLSMRADRTKLRQVLLNLLGNACKFTEHGTIVLAIGRETASDGDWITLAVADTGIGITAEQRDRLFAGFSQGDASTGRRYGGTGLGLAISRHFCRLMGGDIAVQSEAGRGSTFTIRIPEGDPGHGPAAPPAATGSEASPAMAGTVLVIDDDPAVHDLMRRSLQTEGFRIVTSSVGEDGLRLAKTLRPDTITLDVLMPGLDGWSVLAALKSDPDLADIPVVVLTIADERGTGYALGAAEYLTKPLDRDRLAAVLRKYRRTQHPGPILLVEDDAATRELLRGALTKEGWTVAEAETGRTALSAVALVRPALILLDLVMPEMDGFEFLAALRDHEAWRAIPVVVITAKDLTGADRERLSGQVARVLQKGAYGRKDLLAEVRTRVAAGTRPPEPDEV